MKIFNPKKAREAWDEYVEEKEGSDILYDLFLWLTEDIRCPNKVCKITEGGCIVCGDKQTIQRINNPIFWDE